MKHMRLHRPKPHRSRGPNELVERVNALSRPGAAQEAQYGTAGITFQGPPLARSAIFELTEAMTYPDLSNVPDDHFDRQPTPFANAKMVWCNQFEPTDVDSEGNPICTYGGTEFSQDVVVWHPGAVCSDGYRSYEADIGGQYPIPSGYACGTPTFAAGDHVYCQWNRQSGRWEIEAPALNIWRVELDATMGPLATQAIATLSDAACDQTIIAFRPESGHHFGVGRGGGTDGNGNAVEGTHAYAIWNPPRQRWEFLTGEFKLICEAVAYDNLPVGGSGAVSLWWLDYPSGQLVDSGIHVMVTNWLHPYILGGTKVTVFYERQEDRWQLLAVDESANAQTLNVVTRVDLVPVMPGVYDLQVTTQSIQLPLWVQIGSPVQG